MIFFYFVLPVLIGIAALIGLIVASNTIWLHTPDDPLGLSRFPKSHSALPINSTS